MEDIEIRNMRNHYRLYGSSEWWWCYDDTLQLITKLLRRDKYVILDDFLLNLNANAINIMMKQLHHTNLLNKNGIIGGGHSGKDVSYNNGDIRSDVLNYFDGDENDINLFQKNNNMKILLDKMSTLIFELKDLNKHNSNDNNPIQLELKNIKTRSKAMMTCYPGNETQYKRHVDNPDHIHNGRKLTCIYYANPDWKKEYGGYLSLFPQATGMGMGSSDSGSNSNIDMEPKLNRIVMFWSDERCPHAVCMCVYMCSYVVMCYICFIYVYISLFV